ncbi:MAG: MFS transporter [Bacillota bacterium]|nr:MFS transporter [Bacillota bacterium]
MASEEERYPTQAVPRQKRQNTDHQNPPSQPIRITARGTIGSSAAEDSPPERRLFSPRYLGLLGAVLLTGTGHGMLAPLMMIYLMAKTGASIGELALAYLPAGIVWATLPEKAGRIGDRHGRRRFMLVGLLSSAAVAVMIPASAGLWPLAIMWAAEAAALSLAMPAEQATVSDLTATDVRGQAYAYYDAAYAGGLTLGPLLGGWLFDHVCHAAPFYADAVILLVAAAVVAAALRGLHNPGTGPGSAPGDRGIS